MDRNEPVALGDRHLTDAVTDAVIDALNWAPQQDAAVDARPTTRPVVASEPARVTGSALFKIYSRRILMKIVRKAVAPVVAALVVLLLMAQVGFATQQPSEKVYWMLISEVPIEKLPEFYTISGERTMPLFAEHGYRWIASWQTSIGDIEEVVSVAEFDNIGAYHEARVSLLGSAAWTTAQEQQDSASQRDAILSDSVTFTSVMWRFTPVR